MRIIVITSGLSESQRRKIYRACPKLQLHLVRFRRIETRIPRSTAELHRAAKDVMLAAGFTFDYYVELG